MKKFLRDIRIQVRTNPDTFACAGCEETIVTWNNLPSLLLNEELVLFIRRPLAVTCCTFIYPVPLSFKTVEEAIRYSEQHIPLPQTANQSALIKYLRNGDFIDADTMKAVRLNITRNGITLH